MLIFCISNQNQFVRIVTWTFCFVNLTVQSVVVRAAGEERKRLSYVFHQMRTRGEIFRVFSQLENV